MRTLAVCLVAVLAGCATLLGNVEPELPPPSAAAGPIRVVDGRGPLGPEESAAVLARLRAQAPTDLLVHHLAHVERAIAAPLVFGNDARLLIDGPPTYRAMFAAIARARDHINLETYILESGPLGQQLAAALAAKRAQGVRVNVLFDSAGSIDTPGPYFEGLAAADIAVCEFNPVNPLKASSGWQINNRDHRKILIVDGRVAFTGGINISGVYAAGSFGSKRRAPSKEEGWRDTHVRVEGPIVAEFQRLFVDTWKRQNCPEIARANYFPRLAQRGDKIMRLVAANPESKTSETYIALLSALSSARERIWLTYGYFVPDRRTIDVLKDAALRGVDVRLVLPGFSDFWAPFHAGRSHYTELLEAGVQIFERRDALLHAKTAVVDGVWSSVGSTNMDWRSFVHNYEADVLVLDREFAREMERLFRLDVEASHEVTRDEWRRRGLALRVKEWFARRWEYLL